MKINATNVHVQRNLESTTSGAHEIVVCKKSTKFHAYEINDFRVDVDQ